MRQPQYVLFFLFAVVLSAAVAIGMIAGTRGASGEPQSETPTPPPSELPGVEVPLSRYEDETNGSGLGPPPERQGPDFLLPPPEAPGVMTVPRAPSSTQTSEFMAGTAVYSVVFIESSGGSGNCSPAAPQTENWDAGRQTTVLSEISQGLNFWATRSSSPDPLTFVLDNQGVQPTSCEPITGSSSDEPKWVADVLTAMGFPATTGDYFSVARSFAESRRTALAADWGFTIFVIDSLNDADGLFTNPSFAYAYLNGPFMVMTYDNDGWGITRMNLVTAHETGHIFGALDEYASSGCSTADSWGYLNAANTSCNNGGNTSDTSIMGESSEQDNPAVDVSTSARDAIGWRNPTGTVVDVVRTSTASLTPYVPDPTSDTTPAYSASAGNVPFPPEGPRVYQGVNYGTVAPVTISSVAGAEWNLDGGAFTSTGVSPDDGAFDQETEFYTFTPPSALANGTYTFGTRSINNFGHLSSVAVDTLTLLGPTPTPSPCNVPSWNWDSQNCFGTESLWHHETSAEISGMTGGMLAFNQACTGPGVTGCNYDTSAQVSGRASSPAFSAPNGGTLGFKTARSTENDCGAYDQTFVLYSTDGGATYVSLDLLAGVISSGGQSLAAGGEICGESLTAQTVTVPLPSGTTNVAFDFDSGDSLFNDFAGQFIDDVQVTLAATSTPTATPTFTSTPTNTPTATPTFTSTPTNTATATPTFTSTPMVTPTVTPTSTITPTPTKQPEPGDTDGDGCSDQRENGPDETIGGLRNYKNPWDFYDVYGAGQTLVRDGVIDLPNDILGVIQHFAPTGAPPYDVRFDRGPSAGPNPWNMTAPDGVIDLPNDILGVILQFNHRCV